MPRAYNSLGVEAYEDDLDPWGESAGDPSLEVDEVHDDSNIVASNTGREILSYCVSSSLN